MAVTSEDVRHVAQLARLGLPEDQLAAYVEQLNGILAHMDALQAVSSAGAADAAAALAPSMRLRPDDLGPVPLAIPPARFAPSMRDGFFLVPRLSTHEDAGEES
jgi:aspartyl-tRNA(Asn)/glutamyl-tRNA(Gln) amidotransferase subunit C